MLQYNTVLDTQFIVNVISLFFFNPIAGFQKQSVLGTCFAVTVKSAASSVNELVE